MKTNFRCNLALLLSILSVAASSLASGPICRISRSICQTARRGPVRFPPGFKLGASTADYQIEGSWNVDGKGENIWDRFVHQNASRIVGNATGDVGGDSYRLYREDVATLKKIGFDSYRFSISWARILPTGFSNNVNRAGIAHYKNLLRELARLGIEPMVTMSHWAHPQVLEDMGGWTNERMVDWFADYARVLFRELGPWVKKWATVNEPEIHCTSAYMAGTHAPGKTLRGIGEYLCVHHMLQAHARAYRIYQQEFKRRQKGSVGIVLGLSNYYPKNPSRDQLAAEIAFNFTNSWSLHPIFSEEGDYHPLLKELVAKRSEKQGYPQSRLPVLSDEWVDYIRGSADFLGLNHYTSFLVSIGEGEGEEPSFDRDQGLILSADPSWTQGASQWLNIVPDGFRHLLNKIAYNYGNVPIFITENGISDRGGTDDQIRIGYFHDYLRQMLLAIYCDGVNVQGYYVWSYLDTFEWERGYSEKFGIVAIDFEDPGRKRTLKDSAYWWQSVLKSRVLEPATSNEVWN